MEMICPSSSFAAPLKEVLFLLVFIIMASTSSDSDARKAESLSHTTKAALVRLIGVLVVNTLYHTDRSEPYRPALIFVGGKRVIKLQKTCALTSVIYEILSKRTVVSLKFLMRDE